MTTLPTPLRTLALQQDGVLTWAQLRDAGVPEASASRLVRSWQRIHPGVWFTTPQVDGVVAQRALARAAVLHAGPRSRLCLGSAAYLHGIVDGAPPVATVFVPYGSKVATRPGLVVRRERVGVRLPSEGSPPVTGVEDTVLDLTNEGGPGRAVHWVTQAVQRRLTTVDRLRERSVERHPLKHRQLLDELLADVGQGATTPLELRALRTVFRPHGLPQPRWQQRIGGLDYVVDAVYEEFALAVELDGRRGHIAEGVFRDRRRDNAHARAGWTTLRYGWAEVADDPCGVAAQIESVLRSRGWTAEDAVQHPRCAA